MNRFQKAVSAIIAAITIVALPTAAHAQRNPTVLTIDRARVLQESQVGQSIANQIEAYAQQAQTELSGHQAQLQQEGRALQASRESMDEADFQQRARGILGGEQNLQQLSQIRQAELVQAERQATAQVLEALDPIIDDVVRRNRGDLLLDESQVVWANEKMDITDDVISRLNRQMGSIQVTKPDLLAQAQAQAAAQQGQ